MEFSLSSSFSEIFMKNCRISCKFSFDLDNLSFEVDKSFTDKQKSDLSCIIKKVKKLDLTDDQLLYFLPGCVLVNCNLVFNLLEMFEFFFDISKRKTNSLITALTDSMFNILLDVLPDIYSKQNLEVYMASKKI